MYRQSLQVSRESRREDPPMIPAWMTYATAAMLAAIILLCLMSPAY